MLVRSALDTASNNRPTVRAFARLGQNRLRTLWARDAAIWKRERLSCAKHSLLLTMQASPSDKVAHRQGVCSRAGAYSGNGYKDQERIHCWLMGNGPAVDWGKVASDLKSLSTATSPQPALNLDGH